jgi:hypothetical protein
MSGYRAREEAPPPLTWTQRAGIACLFIGAAIVFAYIAGRLGVVRQVLDSPVLGTAFVAVAAPLISMRGGPLSPETKRLRLIIVAIALAVFVAAIAVGLYFGSAGR